MDSVQRSEVTPSKSRLARVFAKVLHVRALTGISSSEKTNSKNHVKVEGGDSSTSKGNQNHQKSLGQSTKVEEAEIHENIVALETLVAKIFASISSIKAAYAELQLAQSPYDANTIQSADQLVVSELKTLSELKQSYLKRQFDPDHNALLSAEIQEHKSVLKTYQIMIKKFESQLKFKESEVHVLKEKLEELKTENRLVEKKLNASGQLSALENLHLSGLSSTHFIPVLRHAVRSIRNFVKVMISEMRSAGWDVDAAAHMIHPNVRYWNPDHVCFAFESFVCREMFEGFQHPNFSLPEQNPYPNPKCRSLFFDRFTELKSLKAKDYLGQNRSSCFAKFCRAKYLRLVHPKMESACFRDLSQRNLINSGEFPNTTFSNAFAEMAKRVWLLHCLSFSFEPAAMIFQVKRGCRFSDLYMESLAEEAFLEEADPCVAFTVVPGFKIGKTVIQCEVYLSSPSAQQI